MRSGEIEACVILSGVLFYRGNLVLLISHKTVMAAIGLFHDMQSVNRDAYNC